MGKLVSGGTTRSATPGDLESYERMREQQAKQAVPVLYSHRSPHDFLFIALFDGTGQDVRDPQQLPTNVGKLQLQARALKGQPGSRVSYYYAEGIGTQKNPIARLVDGAVAYSWDERIQRAYREMATTAKFWIIRDPQAEIRLAGVGYSRGAVLVPGFARLVDQYGIVDPQGMTFGRDEHGNLTVSSPRTLVPPGQVAQAVGLFDPVGTNMPANYDARLPKSVLSGFAQIARDEQRELFPHQTIIDPDWSDDGRFLSVPVPGGHSNVGGGNDEAGLEVLAFNGMADYLNALSDEPLFAHREVPMDPSQYTVYQAQGATAAFGMRMDDDGQRDLRDELANCKIVDLCHDADPVDMKLARQFEWQQVKTVADPVPTLEKQAQMSPSDLIMEDYLDAMRAGDDERMSTAAIAMANSDYGKQLIADAEQWEVEQLQAVPGRQHPLFRQAVQHLERLGPDEAGYSTRTDMERIAGSIAHEAQRNHMRTIDDLYPVGNGDRLLAVTERSSFSVHSSHAIVETEKAMSQPLDQSLQELAQVTQQQEQMAQAQAQERVQQQSVGRSR